MNVMLPDLTEANAEIQYLKGKIKFSKEVQEVSSVKGGVAKNTLNNIVYEHHKK